MTVGNTPENAERCICPSCPTYTDCMRNAEELLFCARGESGCSPKAISCTCTHCTVWSKYELSNLYFCLHGVAS